MLLAEAGGVGGQEEGKRFILAVILHVCAASKGGGVWGLADLPAGVAGGDPVAAITDAGIEQGLRGRRTWVWVSGRGDGTALTLQTQGGVWPLLPVLKVVYTPTSQTIRSTQH